MTIYLKIKALSKRKPLIERTAFVIDRPVTTSNDLIQYLVGCNVNDYNQKAVDVPLFPYLTEDGLADSAETGKIGFADRKNDNTQDTEQAVENALTCFRDGIFRLFINETEAAFGESIQLNEGDEITFIRLTMLAGSLW